MLVLSGLLAVGYFYSTQESSKKKLVAVTKNSPTTYYFDRYDLESGFEYELLKSFAAAVDMELDIRVEAHIDKMRIGLDSGEFQILASGLTITKERKEMGWEFGPSYAKTKEVLICRKGIRIDPKDIDTYKDRKLVVVAGSSYLSSLVGQGYKLEHWSQQDINTEEALALVESSEYDCTVADEHIYKTQARYAENLVRRNSLSNERSLAWVISPEDKIMKEKLNRWMFDFLSSGKLEALYEKYYGYVDPKFNRFDVKTFRERKKERLDVYKKLFQEAGKKYDVPWELIAAISYQESHWDPSAVSPTGVRGLMMLTRETARLMGVNRLKVKESIDGGVRYLKMIKARLPKGIKEPDRTWISLAAYNVGIGHIFDVRGLIRDNRGNPDIWKEIKFYLPYLSKEKVYRKLRYGYARGWEPVKYVKRIRTYYEILKKDEETSLLKEESHLSN